MDIAYSVNDVPIRLTVERWYHIVENHDDLAGHYDDVLAHVGFEVKPCQMAPIW